MSLTGRTFQFNTTLTGNDMVGARRMENDQSVEFFTTPYQSISSCMLLYTVEGNDVWMGYFPVNGEDYEDMYINGTWEDNDARTITFTAEPNNFPPGVDATSFEAWLLANATEIISSVLAGRTFWFNTSPIMEESFEVEYLEDNQEVSFFTVSNYNNWECSEFVCYVDGETPMIMYYDTESNSEYGYDEGYWQQGMRTIKFTADPNQFSEGWDLSKFAAWIEANSREIFSTQSLVGRTFKLHNTINPLGYGFMIASETQQVQIPSTLFSTTYESANTNCCIMHLIIDDQLRLVYMDQEKNTHYIYDDENHWDDDATRTITFKKDPVYFIGDIASLDEFNLWLAENADEVVTKYIVASTDLNGIASAIRGKIGNNQSLAFPADFINKINTIKTSNDISYARGVSF